MVPIIIFLDFSFIISMNKDSMSPVLSSGIKSFLSENTDSSSFFIFFWSIWLIYILRFQNYHYHHHKAAFQCELLQKIYTSYI